jgi:hypothetical protein
MSTIGGPNVVDSGLVLELDAANTKSYVSGSTNWFNLTPPPQSGSLINGPTFSTGSGGNIVFDGTDDYVDCGNASTLSLSSQGTISAIVQTSRSYPGNTASNSFKGIIGKILSGGGGQQSYWLDWYGTNATRILRLGIGDAAGSTTLEIGNFDFLNNWNYVLGTWNGSTAQIYVNGVIRGSVANTRVAQTLVNSLTVGRVFEYWEGNIAFTQVYNRFLSANEALQNYNALKSRFGL